MVNTNRSRENWTNMRTHNLRLLAGPALLLSLLACLLFSASASAGECPNSQLRAESTVSPVTHQPYSEQLPDCRAYELVSPPSTGGIPAYLGMAYNIQAKFLTTPEGPVFWQSQATPAGTSAVPDGGYLDIFRSRRTSSGWTTGDVLSHSQAGNVLLLATSVSGSSVLVETMLPLSPEDVDDPTGNVTTGQDLYVVREGEATPEFVTHGEVPNRVLGEGRVDDGSVHSNPELTTVGFETSMSLAFPHATEESTAGCYVWTDVDGGLAEPTDRDEGGTPNPGKNCEYFAVAADGRPIVRITDGEIGNREIVAIDPSSATDGEPLMGGSRVLAGAEAQFDAISPDAKTVYFTTPEELTPEGAGEAVANIYGVGLDGLPTTCISCEAAGAANTARAEYVGQSADDSHVYFTVQGTLYQHDASGIQELAPQAGQLENLVFSQNGRYVLVSTSASLSSSDTNGTADLYELSAGSAPKLITGSSPSTTGTHPVAVSNSGERVLYDSYPAENASYIIDEWMSGQIDQLSPLGSSYRYEVLGTTGPELENVFFASNDGLVAQDENAGTTDIYDARIDGGFPAPSAPANENQTPNPTVPMPTAYTPNLTPATVTLSRLAPDTSTPSVITAKSLPKAANLTKALQVCKKDKKKSKRAACEKRARKRYSTNAQHKKSTSTKGGK
jgi:hypothetical protein